MGVDQVEWAAGPGHAEPGVGDDVALHVVDAAAERVDLGGAVAALGLADAAAPGCPPAGTGPRAPSCRSSVRYTSTWHSVPYTLAADEVGRAELAGSRRPAAIFQLRSFIASRRAWQRARSCCTHGTSIARRPSNVVGRRRHQSTTSAKSCSVRPPSAARPTRSWLSWLVIRRPAAVHLADDGVQRHPHVVVVRRGRGHAADRADRRRAEAPCVGWGR